LITTEQEKKLECVSFGSMGITKQLKCTSPL